MPKVSSRNTHKKKLSEEEHYMNLARFLYWREVTNAMAKEVKKEKKKTMQHNAFIKLSERLNKIKLFNSKI
jgi:hypothetical protein